MEEAKVRQVIETNSLIGKGVEGDPIRNIIQYWDFDGLLLATRDPWAESEKSEGVRKGVE